MCPKELEALKRLVEKIEKALMRIVIIGFVLIVIVQGVMTNDPIRLYLSWGERMEGQILEFPVASQNEPVENEPITVNSPQAVLTLSVDQFSSLPRAKILVNDEERSVFDSREIEVPVMAGDIIEIDCTQYDFPIKFAVKGTSENLSYPEQGKVYTANKSIVMIGKVIVK
jgi:hypothetical protein